MEKKLAVLLAEDDVNLGQLLSTYLKSKGFNVTLATDGQIALDTFNSGKFNFCIFDVMMPKIDGFSLAKEVRELDKKIPILFLTAKDMKEDKLEGFATGADDYLTKPFSMEELVARINAIARRTGSDEAEVAGDLFVGTIKYEPELRLLHTEGEAKKLTTKENQLLELLVKNKNEVLDRQATLRAVWGDDNYFNGRSMDVYIAKLRKLLKEDPNIEIMNIHGKGFKLLIK
ncbi:response regulator transcription factor [Crocinitomicaceae bacterium CZZ-1]|uniref:Response regulator transcription factor n=1 Tax=Taishania pollutisoli TaxID=2766479 RepID=A0A8J6TSW7_9FLAO|nr:response regulator transcription factor [Taishania pollutisoli]MBC9811949.1 response regulator transcription factor [Taishania pollutisoli]MBX2949977.1 response regulator transcription factor [Crocinitomicaceae bacterium]NGF74896.1 response regulator transcription factor [Fluviicola sp. SGL-29]